MVAENKEKEGWGRDRKAGGESAAARRAARGDGREGASSATGSSAETAERNTGKRGKRKVRKYGENRRFLFDRNFGG